MAKNTSATTLTGGAYEDKRLQEVEADKEAALTEVEETYGGMIEDADKFYQDQIDATQDWADTQTELQNQQTDFAIEQINQQKEQAQKDYTREQSGAYVDYQKQTDQYGANAEQMASVGMDGTGFSESSKVSMYNTYQNRVAVAREAVNRAMLEYDNAITQARLQNNAALAEIAAQTLEKKLEIALQQFQYKNTLVLGMAEQKAQVERDYLSRYNAVQNQINWEKEYAEGVRQFNAQMAEQRRQFNILHSGSSGGGSIKKSGGGSSSGKKSSGGSSSVKKGSGSSSISGSGGKNPSIDMQSVLNLGQGPISAATLDNMVKSGQVKEYVEDGKLKFKRVYTTPKNTKYSSTLNKALGNLPKKKEGGSAKGATKKDLKVW